MSSPIARLFLHLLTVLYALLGAILFISPEWSSQNFAWKISPWIAMTIGAWCLGNAYFAWLVAKVWKWNLTYAGLIYLWAFGILQTLVLILFREKLLLSGLVSWLYIVTLAVNLIAAIIGLAEWFNQKPKIKPEGPPLVTWVKISLYIALTFVIITTAAMLLNPTPIINGEIMPEKVSMFTITSFAMFYLSIFLSALSLVKTKFAGPLLFFGKGTLALMIPITAASIFFFNAVNFGVELGALLYIGIYAIIIVVVAIALLSYRKKTK